MRIIGITGAIGHGKTTLAEAFLKAEPSSVHLESFYVIAEVADALHAKLAEPPLPDDLVAINKWLTSLPKILEKILHLDYQPSPVIVETADIHADPAAYEKLFAHIRLLRDRPELAKQEITNANKQNYRSILQWLGGYVSTRIDARAWYQELVRRAHKAAEDGVELVIVGGVRFPNDASVLREAGGKILKIQRPGLDQADIQDPTERERELVEPDSTIINNGTVEDLYARAATVLTDLRAERLAPEYHAA